MREISMGKVSCRSLGGKVGFSLPAMPLRQLLCYCTDCQTVSGSAFYARLTCIRVT